MAQTTVELRHLIERTNFRLFDFEYQFDDPLFKKQLEQHVLEHYYPYEIGFETPDMFKQRFKAKWMRMIGYYNELYNTTLLSYNPLITTSMSEALEQLGKTTNSQDSLSTTNSTDKGSIKGSTNTKDTNDTQTTTEGDNTTNEKASDYPQQSITGGDYLSGERVTTGRAGSESNSLSATTGESTTDHNSTGESNGTSTGKVTGKSDSETSYQKKIEGMSGTTYQELVRQQRANILRIPDMIVDELKTCFMMVF